MSNEKTSDSGQRWVLIKGSIMNHYWVADWQQVLKQAAFPDTLNVVSRFDTEEEAVAVCKLFNP